MVAPGATLDCVASQALKTDRVFKTAWFTKAARKAHIPDEELCYAIRQVMLGQADDLGGGAPSQPTSSRERLDGDLRWQPSVNSKTTHLRRSTPRPRRC